MQAETRYAKKIEDIFKAKIEFRKERAKLPFEEKIKILVRLQHIAYDIATSTGKTTPGKPWTLENDHGTVSLDAGLTRGR